MAPVGCAVGRFGCGSCVGQVGGQTVGQLCVRGHFAAPGHHTGHEVALPGQLVIDKGGALVDADHLDVLGSAGHKIFQSLYVCFGITVPDGADDINAAAPLVHVAHHLKLVLHQIHSLLLVLAPCKDVVSGDDHIAAMGQKDIVQHTVGINGIAHRFPAQVPGDGLDPGGCRRLLCEGGGGRPDCSPAQRRPGPMREENCGARSFS